MNRPPGQRAETPSDRRLIGLVLAASALYALIYVALWLPEFTGRNDFFVFWAGAKLAAAGDLPQTLYAPEDFRLYQNQLLGQPSSVFAPYAYPPTFLLLTRWLAEVSLTPALLLFLGTSFALFLVAAACAGVGARAVSLTLSPATLLNAVIGQAAFLTASFLIGGLRLAEKRPWSAGALIALLTVKPQLGLLIPVALVAARLWLVLAATLMFGVLFVALSMFVDGPTLWSDWLEAVGRFSVEAARNPSALNLMVSPAGTLLGAGVPASMAYLIQGILSVFVAIFTFMVVRRHGLTPLTIAFIASGSVIVTPYALFYELVLVAFAVVALTNEAGRSGFRSGERVILVWAWILPPVTAPGIAGVNIVAPLIVGALLYAIYRRLDENGGFTATH